MTKLPFLSDRVIFLASLLLVSLSLVMIYSTTAVLALEKYGDEFVYLKRQLASAMIGVTIMVFASFLKLEKIKQHSQLLIYISVGLLLLVLIPGIGLKAGGARRWIDLGFMIFQPVELVKLLSIVFLAGFLARNEGRIKEFTTGTVKPFLCIALLSGLLLLQPDFGSSAVLAAVSLAMMFAAGVRLRSFAIGALVIATLAIIMVIFSPYRMARIVSFMSPFSDASGKGYQLIQSLIAVGSGNLSGVGLGASQQKLYFLPAAHTDFIFAVIAEEFGFIGSCLVLLIFSIILWRGLRLALRLSEDTFLFLLTIGLTLLLVLPAFLNIGVVTGMLPTKGLALPLVSYGGSSLIVSLLCVGLLLAIAKNFNQKVS